MFSVEMTECFKRGLACPNGTICEQASDGSYGCVCHKGFEMVLVGGNKTCKGKKWAWSNNLKPEWILN